MALCWGCSRSQVPGVEILGRRRAELSKNFLKPQLIHLAASIVKQTSMEHEQFGIYLLRVKINGGNDVAQESKNIFKVDSV